MKPLKRHPALIELSRDHHHSLALCVRILRETTHNHQLEIESHIPELLQHFQEEETQFAPYWHHIDPSLRQQFETEHTTLRTMMAHPQYDSEEWNIHFATTLREHARFEERKLFPSVEPFLDSTTKNIK